MLSLIQLVQLCLKCLQGLQRLVLGLVRGGAGVVDTVTGMFLELVVEVTKQLKEAVGEIAKLFIPN